ncbi:uncharacterized protein LOC133381942 isoform X2 [Rhineura floridana]|uniref:uncharacterized protein LOC133381942 isoform X2 n=1 Tax=Rhineura floridana TaxID=261503 RepID=UPI002AC86C86|nr:uncharacterized protein LOC133381942 isoform X2 [Rhineura floridana]
MEENYEIGASFKSELNSCLEDGEDLLIQVPKEEETSAERDLASCKEEESLFIQVRKEEEEETSAELGFISCWERGGEEDPLVQGLKEEEAETSAEPDLISCWEEEDPVMQEPKEEEETSAANTREAMPLAAIRKGRYWRPNEILLMLSFLKNCRKAVRLMGSTPLLTAPIFRSVARQLGDAGYVRTAAQVRSRFKRLKADFFAAMEKFQGPPPPQKRPPYFKQLYCLWKEGGRPSWVDRRPAVHPQPEQLSSEEEVQEAQREEHQRAQEGDSSSGECPPDSPKQPVWYVDICTQTETVTGSTQTTVLADVICRTQVIESKFFTLAVGDPSKGPRGRHDTNAAHVGCWTRPEVESD